MAEYDEYGSLISDDTYDDQYYYGGSGGDTTTDTTTGTGTSTGTGTDTGSTTTAPGFTGDDYFYDPYSGNVYIVKQYDDGSTLTIDSATGETVGSSPSIDGYSGTGGSGLSGLAKGFSDVVKNLTGLFKDANNNTDWRKVAATAGGLYGLYKAMNPEQPQKVGYQGSVPSYTAVRNAVPGTSDPTRRPGSGGQRYFTDVRYAAPADVSAAQTAAGEQATTLAAKNLANPARQTLPPPTGPALPPSATMPASPGIAASRVIEQLPVPTHAHGGIIALARGGSSSYLAGATDGMADKIPARIDGKQEARLSHGEFVLPADVVSHIGNGNSEAGAKRLYTMMDRIRRARTGSARQGKEVNPDKLLPA